MNYLLFTIPFIAALINWLAFRVLIRLIFHNIIPKQKAQIAETLGNMAKEELSAFNIAPLMADPKIMQQILPVAEGHIDHFLRVKLKQSMPVVSFFIGDKTIHQLKTVFMEELENLFPIIITNYADSLKGNIDIKKMVEEKISGFPVEKLSRIIKRSSAFRLAQLIAAVTGFLIGCIQILINILIA